jgi:HSP20 family protein
MVLMRSDPFRDLDRLTQQVFGTAARPAVMPMDAWRDGDEFIVEFDLPGVKADSLDLDVERNVLTVHAERPGLDQNREMVSAERPRGVFSRQLFLGENLDTDKIDANYMTACCGSRSRWLRRLSRVASRSATTITRRRSTPDGL